ncbi:MAG TPA: hypothetical protein VEH84_18845 [Alphaproteobacteria bacterium]|nr:hypothetical protein [Alphaproteobacteria bacterium]
MPQHQIGDRVDVVTAAQGEFEVVELLPEGRYRLVSVATGASVEANGADLRPFSRMARTATFN